MWDLITILGLVGLVSGIIGIAALFAERDGRREKEKAAEQKNREQNGGK